MSDETKPKQWTVMVYMAGDNNLSEEMVFAVKEMYRVGANDEFDVIVQFDPSAIGPSTRRYVISRQKIDLFKRGHIEVLKNKSRAFAAAAAADDRPDKNPSNHYQGRQEDFGLDADGLLEDLKEDDGKNVTTHLTTPTRLNKRVSEMNSASPQELKDFICKTIEEHKADHYMLVLSGHGSGAEGDFLPENPGAPGRLPRSLSIPSLGRVLREVKDLFGNKIDILGMDSCLMSMAEVGFEVSESVKYLVGSEGFELNTGWPYHRILETLKDKLKPGAPMKEDDLAETIVRKYSEYYTDYQLAGASTDLSVCNLEKIQELKNRLLGLAAVLNKGLDDPVIKNAIVLAHWDAQSYKSDQYVDLWDFCTRLQLYCIRDATVGEAVMQEEGLIKQKLKREKSQELEQKLQKLQKLKSAIETLRASEHLATLQKVIEDLKLLNTGALQQLKNVIEDCQKVKGIIHNGAAGVVLKSCYSGAASQHSHGISVYFPWTESDFLPINPAEKYASLSEKEKEFLPKYENLKFAIKLNDEGQPKLDGGKPIPEAWVTFLRKYLEVTRRDRRDQDKHLIKVNGTEKPDEKFLRFDAPNETVLFVRHTSSNAARTTDSETSSMKNPPDGFYRDECSKR